MKRVVYLLIVGMLPGCLAFAEDKKAETDSPSPQSSSEKKPPETVVLPGGVPLEMVWILGGTFTMGSPGTEQDREAYEGPQQAVTLNGFWMGKYEFTQAQWKAVTGGANPSHYQGGSYGNTDNRPVEHVSWDIVTQTFLPALNTATGLTFRLPSEAEWEFACRAGTTTRFYWGDDQSYTDIRDYAWFFGNSDYQTHDVGGKLANAFGLYDMSGNMWEWCEDDWHGSYAGAPANGQAWVESPRRSFRVIRGGYWIYQGHGCRSAIRHRFRASCQSYGFRVARTP